MDDLLNRIRQGVPDAAAELIARHELPVRLYAAKVAPRPDMAEDVAQKAFVLALESIDRFDPTRDFVLWMHGIVRNVARQEWTRLAARARVERDGLAEYLEQLAAEEPSESEEERARWLAALSGCLDRLPDRGREMIRLRYGLGVNCREVAERVGQTVGAVKMAMVRLREKLQHCVKATLAGG